MKKQLWTNRIFCCFVLFSDMTDKAVKYLLAEEETQSKDILRPSPGRDWGGELKYFSPSPAPTSPMSSRPAVVMKDFKPFVSFQKRLQLKQHQTLTSSGVQQQRHTALWWPVHMYTHQCTHLWAPVWAHFFVQIKPSMAFPLNSAPPS